MSGRRSINAVFQEVKQRRNAAKNYVHASTASECELGIDPDYDDNLFAVTSKTRNIGIRAVDEPTNLTCRWDECEQNFRNETKFKLHLDSHVQNVDCEDGSYPCKFLDCSHVAPTESLLYRHVAYHAYHERLKNIGHNVAERLTLPKCCQSEKFEIPEQYNYTCAWEDCTRSFNVIQDFLMHIRIHLNSNPRYCKAGEFVHCYWNSVSACSAKFSSLYKLSDHMRTHTKSKTLACPTCGHLFATKTKFIDHRKRHIPIEHHSYQCSECNKLFPSERILRNHMGSHINHYKCGLCDMTCSKPSQLTKHIQFRHSEERPYKCNFCEFAAVTKSNLEVHLSTHCADKLMACEECDFKCRSLYTLEKHCESIHGAGFVAAYECHECQKRFYRGAILTKHLVKKHGIKWPAGHSRFRYKEDADGFFRLQTVRYESLEVTELMMNSPPIPSNLKYNLAEEPGSSNSKRKYVVTIAEGEEEEDDDDDDDDDFKSPIKLEPVEPAVKRRRSSRIKNKQDHDVKAGYMVMVSESGEENIVRPTNNDIIIRIDDVDVKGHVIKSEIVESKEIISADDIIRN